MRCVLLAAASLNRVSAFALFAPMLARLVHLIELVQPAGALAQARFASAAAAVLALAWAAQLAGAVAQTWAAAQLARAVVELEQPARVAVAPKCAAFQLNLANRR